MGTQECWTKGIALCPLVGKLGMVVKKRRGTTQLGSGPTNMAVGAG